MRAMNSAATSEITPAVLLVVRSRGLTVWGRRGRSKHMRLYIVGQTKVRAWFLVGGSGHADHMLLGMGRAGKGGHEDNSPQEQAVPAAASASPSMRAPCPGCQQLRTRSCAAGRAQTPCPQSRRQPIWGGCGEAGCGAACSKPSNSGSTTPRTTHHALSRCLALSPAHPGCSPAIHPQPPAPTCGGAQGLRSLCKTALASCVIPLCTPTSPRPHPTTHLW